MKVFKNIAYLNDQHKKHQLDLYLPDEAVNSLLIFIHGGTWMNGDKYLYSKFGENLTTHGIAAAVINYRLFPEVTAVEMYDDCEAAVRFLASEIGTYIESPVKLYLCGHSAGGHLSALLSLRSAPENLGGCILIDPFGLNIYSFLRDHKEFFPEPLLKIFHGEDKILRLLSPSEQINNNVRFLILTGGSSYPFLLMDNELFYQSLKAKGCDVKQEIMRGKSHMGMITQFENVNCKGFNSLRKFIDNKSDIS